MRYLIVAVALSVLCFPGCGRLSAIQGSGNIKTEARPGADFSTIEVSNAIQLDATIGEKTSVEVTTDDNLLPHLITEVKDGILTIRFAGSFNSKEGIKVKVVTPKLTTLHGSGATRSSVTGLASDKLTVQLSGASNASLMGKVEQLTAECSGASKIAAKELEAKKVNAQASGASTIEVKSTEAITAQASGASAILYSGSPKSNSVNFSGASTIKAVP